jgi:hypothetical protein
MGGSLSLYLSLSCFSIMFSLVRQRQWRSPTRWWPLVAVVATYGGGGGDLPAPWWLAGRCHLSPVLLLVASGGGGGHKGGGVHGGVGVRGGVGGRRRWWWVGARAVGAARWSGLFFCFMKIHSPRARWASRHMSDERGPACSRRRALHRQSGAVRPSARAYSRGRFHREERPLQRE